MIDETPLQAVIRHAAALEPVRRTEADAAVRRRNMRRIMDAEPEGSGWYDAADLERRAQAHRATAAQLAAEALTILDEWSPGAQLYASAPGWRQVAQLADELAHLARLTIERHDAYQEACDRIPDCPTPYAHNLAHTEPEPAR